MSSPGTNDDDEAGATIIIHRRSVNGESPRTATFSNGELQHMHDSVSDAGVKDRLKSVLG